MLLSLLRMNTLGSITIVFNRAASQGVAPRKAPESPEVLFGRELTKRRRKLGISQEELGFRAGIHRTYVSQMERGIKSPTLTVILKLSKALHCSAAQLVAAVESRAMPSRCQK